MSVSKDVIQLIETIGKNEIETQLAMQCAPLLTGIKIANLLIVNKQNRDAVTKIFQKTIISHYVIFENENKIIFLLYQKNDLTDYLNRSDVRNTLFKLGYDRYELQDILREFSKRYFIYIEQRGKFPHEMGLLLGYPLEDVVGFIENEGKNFLYTGYWKVYSNPSETIKLFDKYNCAREIVIRMIAQGMKVKHIVEIYYSKKYKKIAI